MHDKRNKDKGWREFPSSGEKRSGRKGGLSAWPEQDIRDFFLPEQPPGERSFQRGVNGIFRAIGGRLFGSSAPGRKPGGTFRSERKISRTGRPGVSVSGLGFSRGFSDRDKPEGRPFGRGFQYRLPRKGQVNRGLEGWEARPLGLRGRFLSRPFPPTPPKAGEPGAGGEGWPGPSAPLPQGPSGQRNPVARLAGTARFLVHRRTPNGPVKMQKKFGPMIRISAHGSKIYSR